MKTETINRLQEISDRATAVYGAAESEDRDLTPEEAKELDTLLAEADKLKRADKVAELNDMVVRRVQPERPHNLNTSTEHYQSSFEPAPRNNSVQILNRGDKLVDRMPRTDLTFGGFLRAAVLGAGHDSRYRNALLEGTDSAGGYTVPDILLADVIDRLRANSVLMQAGATTIMLPNGGDTASYAKLVTDPTTTWHRESVTVSDNSPTFGRETFQIRTLVSLVKVSRELLEDSLSVEDVLANAFAQALALEVDRAGILGDGSAGEPLGITNVTGIGSVSMGANGAALADYSPFVDVAYELTQDNAPMPTAFLCHPRTFTAAANLLDSQNQPMMKPEAIAEIPILQTTQIPITDTQGSSTDASKIVAGYFPHLVWGVRSELRLEILKETYASTYEVGFMASLRGDWVVQHAESFANVVGVVPA